MQFQIFTIPIQQAETYLAAMNTFLRSKKVLQVLPELVHNQDGTFWTFCIRYIDQGDLSVQERGKVDYKQVLDNNSFERFSFMRQIRKSMANQEALPAYAIFTDHELSELAKFETLTLEAMKSVKGIGDKRIEKFGKSFLDQLHEKGS